MSCRQEAVTLFREEYNVLNSAIRCDGTLGAIWLNSFTLLNGLHFNTRSDCSTITRLKSYNNCLPNQEWLLILIRVTPESFPEAGILRSTEVKLWTS